MDRVGIQCTTAEVALDRRTDSISIVMGEKAEHVGTNAGRPVALVVAVEVLF